MAEPANLIAKLVSPPLGFIWTAYELNSQRPSFDLVGISPTNPKDVHAWGGLASINGESWTWAAWAGKLAQSAERPSGTALTALEASAKILECLGFPIPETTCEVEFGKKQKFLPKRALLHRMLDSATQEQLDQIETILRQGPEFELTK